MNGNGFCFEKFQIDASEALEHVEEALQVIEEEKKMEGPRNQPHQLARTATNLLVAKAHCIPDVSERGRILYTAVVPTSGSSKRLCHSTRTRINGTSQSHEATWTRLYMARNNK